MAGIGVTPGKDSSDELAATDASDETFDARPNSETPLWLRLAWLPIPLLLVAMAILSVVGPVSIQTSPRILLGLNIAFSMMGSMFVAYLVGRSFLIRSTPGLLLLGCGVVFWGGSGVASVGFSRGDVNVNVTIFGLGALLAALCHLAGVSLSFRRQCRLNPAGFWLAAGYVIAFVALGVVAILAIDGVLPLFFVPGHGGTPFRHILLDLAAAIFAVAAIMFRTANRKALSPFHYWYSYALGLIAVGLFGTVIASTFSSALFWAGRAGQWLGGVYILIAAIASVRESNVWGISLEAALHESETRFRSLYEHAAVGIEQLSNDGRLLMVNPALCRMLGYSESELLGRTVMELTHPDDVAREAELREPVLRGERDSLEVEKRYLHRDGSSVWVHAKASVVKDVSGHPLYRVAIIQDITARKQAEQALRESEERLRLLGDNLPDSAVYQYVHETDGRVRFLYFSAGVERLNGVSVQEVLRDAGELHRQIPTEYFARLVEAEARSARDLSDFDMEVPMCRRDGQMRWMRLRSRPRRMLDGRVVWDGVQTDITEHKQDESALQATLQRFYVILSGMHAAVLLVTDEGRVEFANQAFCDCFGLKDSPADLAGLYARDTIEKIKSSYRYPDETLARIKELLDRGQPVMGEELAMHGGRTFLRDFVPLNVDGKSYGRLWLHNDITERNRAEETLRENQSSAIFATLADFVPQMVWMCMPDGLNIYFNQRWVEYTGMTLEESYGRGWNTPFHPDDKQAAWDAWNRAVQTGEQYRVESRLRAADGKYRWFLMRGAPMRNAAQEIVRWFGTCTDIEELKQAEQTQLVAQRRFTETVVNQLPCCVALVRGHDMTFQLVNPGYQIISPGQEMLGNSLQVVWPEMPGFEERCRRVLETGVPYEVVDEPNMVSRSSGGPPEPAYFSWSVHRVNLPGEDGWGLLITGWETTGRKRAQEALLRSEKLASVGRMAATIAHEINNPLEAVTNLLFIAKSVEALPDSVREYLGLADAELARIAHITRQSLGFYRESNAPAPTSVGAVLESAVDLLKNKIKAKDAIIEKQWDGDVKVTAVAGELRQVFSNFLSNSLDAIDERGIIKLRVSTGAAFYNGRCSVRVTVADNGKGISASSRQHLFEPFFTTKGTVGTGLGLWVSKQIIDKHGGTIRMRSSSNGARAGTVFSVVLPVEPATAVRSQSGGT